MLFDSFNYEDLSPGARSALISTLGDIASNVQMKALPWIDNLLIQADQHIKASLPTEQNILLGLIHCYQVLVPFFQQISGGDKKVKQFFQLYQKLSDFEVVDATVMYEAIELIKVIANAFGRKLNILLRKPIVTRLIDVARLSDNHVLSDNADIVYELVKYC